MQSVRRVGLVVGRQRQSHTGSSALGISRTNGLQTNQSATRESQPLQGASDRTTGRRAEQGSHTQVGPQAGAGLLVQGLPRRWQPTPARWAGCLELALVNCPGHPTRTRGPCLLLALVSLLLLPAAHEQGCPGTVRQTLRKTGDRRCSSKKTTVSGEKKKKKKIFFFLK